MGKEKEILEKNKDVKTSEESAFIEIVNAPIRVRHIVEAGAGMAALKWAVKPAVEKIAGYEIPENAVSYGIAGVGGVATGEITLGIIEYWGGGDTEEKAEKEAEEEPEEEAKNDEKKKSSKKAS